MMEDARTRIPKIDIHVVDHCNFACQLCNHYSPHAPERYYEPEDYVPHLVDLARYAKIRRLNFIGGEPFLHPRLERWISVIRDLDLGHDAMELFIYTNGFWLVDKDSIKRNERILSRIDKLIYTRHEPMRRFDEAVGSRLEEMKTYCRVGWYTLCNNSNYQVTGFTEKVNGRTTCPSQDCTLMRANGYLYRCPVPALYSQYGVMPPASAMFEKWRGTARYWIERGGEESLKDWLTGLPECCQYCNYG